MPDSGKTLALFLPLILAACSTTPLPPEPVINVVSTPPAEEVIEIPDEPGKSSFRITIAAVGDMMLGTDYPENHLPDDDGVSFLAELTPILSAADLTFGNLEGVLVDGGEPGKKCSNPDTCYLFRSPTRYAEHFRDAGFDVLSLANNHARDFGEEGRTSTMEAIAAAGMLHSGREGDFASLERKGLRIAVLAYAVTKNSNLLLDYELAERTVREHAASHDIVIVSFHGGAEGQDGRHVPETYPLRVSHTERSIHASKCVWPACSPESPTRSEAPLPGARRRRQLASNFSIDSSSRSIRNGLLR